MRKDYWCDFGIDQLAGGGFAGGIALLGDQPVCASPDPEDCFGGLRGDRGSGVDIHYFAFCERAFRTFLMAYTDISFTNAREGGITARKLNKLRDDLSNAIAAGGGGAGTGDMLKSVYDTNGDGISDHAALADTAPWAGISGKPSSFAPNAHASTHLSAGIDPIGLATSVLAGLCPAVDNATIQVVTSKLSCVALAWTAITGKPATFPPDSTAMLKSVYDTNADNIVDHAALADTATNANAVPWTGVTGKPSTFPPDNTAMLKSVYDTNANNKVDAAESADSVPWTGVSGKPTSFAPSAHASTHLDNGRDVVPVVTITRTGLVPKLSGDSSTFLNGNGAFTSPPAQAAIPGILYKSAAYTVLAADQNKYIICSGGSWTLTLPAAAAGLCYNLRNDMGITGVTGTITIQPPSGTIDGVASLALLPQQECTIVCDGSGWRSFGLKREIILGVQDITVSTANAFVLLPIGYRHFELTWTGLQPATINDTLRGVLSSNGGSTWLTSANYFNGFFYPSSATAVAYQFANTDTFMRLGGQNSTSGMVRTIIYPGAAGRPPSFISDSGGYNSTIPVIASWRSQGFYNGNVLANALQYYFTASNITNSLLIVKGFV